MFTQPWFYLFLISHFFINVLFRSEGTKKQILYFIATICSIALIVLAILGIFWGEKWWQGIVALIITGPLSIILYSILSALIKNEALLIACMFLGIFITPISTIAAYYFMLFHH